MNKAGENVKATKSRIKKPNKKVLFYHRLVILGCLPVDQGEDEDNLELYILKNKDVYISCICSFLCDMNKPYQEGNRTDKSPADFCHDTWLGPDHQ